MSNILEAICNICELELIEIQDMNTGNNRMNNQGDGLELFIRNAFSNNFEIEDALMLEQNNRNTFSYTGGMTTPPDMMLHGSDAIEVKKTMSVGADLQLNSSHPKDKLHSSNPFITENCRNCEVWEQKDMLYIIGHLHYKTKDLKSLWFIYGDLYAAEERTYLNLKEGIQGFMNGYDVDDEDTETDELGRFNAIDPLRITHLRVRGMWLLKSPSKVFDYVYNYNRDLNFQICALIPTTKYNSFSEASRLRIENLISDNFTITDVEIKNPNNPMVRIPSKLIQLKVI